jgi:hypothetical protein
MHILNLVAQLDFGDILSDSSQQFTNRRFRPNKCGPSSGKDMKKILSVTRYLYEKLGLSFSRESTHYIMENLKYFNLLPRINSSGQGWDPILTNLPTIISI